MPRRGKGAVRPALLLAGQRLRRCGLSKASRLQGFVDPDEQRRIDENKRWRRTDAQEDVSAALTCRHPWQLPAQRRSAPAPADPPFA